METDYFIIEQSYHGIVKWIRTADLGADLEKMQFGNPRIFVIHQALPVSEDPNLKIDFEKEFGPKMNQYGWISAGKLSEFNKRLKEIQQRHNRFVTTEYVPKLINKITQLENQLAKTTFVEKPKPIIRVDQHEIDDMKEFFNEYPDLLISNLKLSYDCYIRAGRLYKIGNIDIYGMVRKEIIEERLSTVEGFEQYVNSTIYKHVVEFFKKVQVSADANVDDCYQEYMNWNVNTLCVSKDSFKYIREKYFQFYQETKPSEVVNHNGDGLPYVQYANTPNPIEDAQESDPESIAINFIISKYSEIPNLPIGNFYEMYESAVKSPIGYEDFNRFMVTQGFRTKIIDGRVSWIMDE